MARRVGSTRAAKVEESWSAGIVFNLLVKYDRADSLSRALRQWRLPEAGIAQSAQIEKGQPLSQDGWPFSFRCYAEAASILKEAGWAAPRVL